MFNEISKTVEMTLTDKLLFHKKRFYKLFFGRYRELLPSLISYKKSTTNIDFVKVEIALRNGYNIAIGDTVEDGLQVLGYVVDNNSIDTPENLFGTKQLHHNDIRFIIPKSKRLRYYKEISYYDNCKSGNFVVLRNKNINCVNDYEIIEHYIDELAEITLSRYSISMQAKISSIFQGQIGDESINQIVTQLYNGTPFIKSTKLFDVKDDIHEIGNTSVASLFSELKREFQNKISEMNNMLGINSLAVEKESGVSDAEADSNRGYTSSNANIYLSARNNSALEKLNARYGTELQAYYNDNVASEIQKFSNYIEMSENNDNNNFIQNS